MQFKEVAQNFHKRFEFISFIEKTVRTSKIIAIGFLKIWRTGRDKYRAIRISFPFATKNLSRIPARLPITQSAPFPPPYDKPTVRKLTLEQGRLIVLGHSTLRDPGAQDLMPLLFPDEFAAS